MTEKKKASVKIAQTIALGRFAPISNSPPEIRAHPAS